MSGQSPSQTVGPFFHNALIHGGENILVNDLTSGPRILLTGQVLDGDGQPIPDAMVEIWQADANGYFNHENDPHQAKADPHFHGFGRADTVNNGRYTFKTIKPGIISGHVTPFVNVHIFARGMLIHAMTRIYFGDESGNAQDELLNSLDPDRRQTLIAQPQQTGDLPTYCLNIHMQGDGETVFFNP